MTEFLFQGDCAELIVAEFRGAVARSGISRLHGTADASKRESLRQDLLCFTQPAYAKAEASETNWTLVYRQAVTHPRLARAERRLELWKAEPRARVTLRFDRLSSVSPEVLYASFTMPAGVKLPTMSNGGTPFVPYLDQLPGSCHDYYAIDGWARYRQEAGDWLWITRDAPLISLGGPQTVARRSEPPSDSHRIAAVLFDNCWHTNFVADSNGTMAFTFDIVWSRQIDRPAEMAEALVSQPIVVLNPAGRMAAALQRYM